MKKKERGCTSVVKHLTDMCTALCLNPSNAKNKKIKKRLLSPSKIILPKTIKVLFVQTATAFCPYIRNEATVKQSSMNYLQVNSKEFSCVMWSWVVPGPSLTCIPSPSWVILRHVPAKLLSCSGESQICDHCFSLPECGDCAPHPLGKQSL